MRIPLIISVPWMPEAHGLVHTGMAEMCDFYLTLSDLVGLPRTTVDAGVECDSLAPIVSSRAGATGEGKLYAFSQTQVSVCDHHLVETDSGVLFATVSICTD